MKKEWETVEPCIRHTPSNKYQTRVIIKGKVFSSTFDTLKEAQEYKQAQYDKNVESLPIEETKPTKPKRKYTKRKTTPTLTEIPSIETSEDDGFVVIYGRKASVLKGILENLKL